MPKLAPTIKLNSGADYPIVGLGTWKSPPGQVEQAVKDAIDAGYRHIDGAFLYLNETEVGAGIRAKIAEGVIKREDVFVTSKLWNTFHRPDLVEESCRTSLKLLGLDYLDLYLIHWPTGYEEGGDLVPTNPDGSLRYSYVDHADVWKAMEKLVHKGLVRSIGLSNFNSEQIEYVIKNSTIKPAVLQIECHAHLNQKKLIAFCKARNIVVTAYSPLGSPDRPWAKPDDPQLLEDPKIKAMAAKYKKTPAQVVLRYLIQNEAYPVPKSVTKHRIIENFQVFDFKLSPEDVATMDTFDCNGRICPHSEDVSHKYYPFHIPF